jgi:hypothetical protein
MLFKEKNTSAGGFIILLLVILNVLIMKLAFIHNEKLYWAMVVTVPLLLAAILRDHQKKQAILRNFPLMSHLRYFFGRFQARIKTMLLRKRIGRQAF